DPVPKMVEAAVGTGTDRIELYTEDFARKYPKDAEMAIKPYQSAAKIAQEVGLGLNAGHDLSLENIAYFSQNIPGLLEVSIGHALISEALYLGLKKTIKEYLRKLP